MFFYHRVHLDAIQHHQVVTSLLGDVIALHSLCTQQKSLRWLPGSPQHWQVGTLEPYGQESFELLWWSRAN